MRRLSPLLELKEAEDVAEHVLIQQHIAARVHPDAWDVKNAGDTPTGFQVSKQSDPALLSVVVFRHTARSAA